MARLMPTVRATVRRLGYSDRTEDIYASWIRRYIRFHGMRHPRGLGPGHVVTFLASLASEHNASAGTQRQALAAIRFLYRHVLEMELAALENIPYAKRPVRLPVVLRRDEVRAVLGQLEGVSRLQASLLYGAGLRLMECCKLRVKDLDLSSQAIHVRDGKGRKDRYVPLPQSLVPALRDQLAHARALHQRDQSLGAGWVALPGNFGAKSPRAGRTWSWQWVFPAARRHTDRDTGQRRRHHRHESTLQRAVSQAVADAGITKRATCHTFRHSFATHLLQDGYDIRTIQQLMGHADLRTTMVYTHVIGKAAQGVRSPLDTLNLDQPGKD